MRQIIFIVIVFCISVASAAGQAGLERFNADLQFWNETTVEFSLYKNEKNKEILNGVVITNLRAVDDISTIADRRIGFAVKYKGIKHVTIQPSYIFRNVRALGLSLYEHRVRLDIVPKKSFRSFSLENRSRFEHRIRTSGIRDATFYRNRTKIKIPVRKDDATLFSPFVSNDTYFDLRRTRVHRNDSVVGISKKFTKHFTTDVFFQYRKNFHSVVEHINIIGVNLKFKIN